MSTLRLQAVTQNGEWDGTSAADNMDWQAIKNFFVKNGSRLEDDEFVVAVEIESSELSHGNLLPPTITFYILDVPETHSAEGFGIDIARQNARKHIHARAISIKSNLETIFSLFKRFNIIISRKSMDIKRRTLRIEN